MASPMTHHMLGAKHHMLGRRHHMMAMRRSAMRSMPISSTFSGASSSRMSTPWAIVGMAAAFIGGAALGMFGGKKYAEGHESGMSGAWYMAAGEADDLAAPGALDESADDRYEGE